MRTKLYKGALSRLELFTLAVAFVLVCYGMYIAVVQS
jgi:hypothetical protein